MKRVPIEKIVEDMEFYPRNEVNSTVVTSLADALEAGAKLPPPVLDDQFRIVDGWHRVRAHKRLKAETVLCDVRHFESDAEMFKTAVDLNAHHGRRLDTYDLKRSVIKMQELGIEMAEIAQVIRVTPERLAEIAKGNALGSKGQIPLKRGVHYLANIKLSKRQQEAVERASGMQATYHVNQLINLLENDIAPKDDQFIEAMDRLMAFWKLHRKQVAS